MVSILLGVWNGGGCCCCSTPVQWCGSRPTHPTAVLISTAVMSCTVPCQVCGVRVVGVCLWCSCGGVSSVRSPLTVVEGGAIVDGGVPLWWWVAWQVKGGSVDGPPVCVLASPSLVREVALLKGGGCAASDAPSSDWILPLTLFSSLRRCPVPSRIVSSLFCLVCGGMMQCEMGRAVRVMNGGV